MNILFIDLETTGLDPVNNQILEIAADYYQGRELKQSYHGIIGFDNNFPISIGALLVNKRKLASIPKDTPLLNERTTYQEFVDWLADVYVLNNKEKITIGGHNVHFDFAFLKERLSIYDIHGLEDVLAYRLVDVASIAAFLKDIGLLNVDKTSSEKLAEAFGLKYAQQHVASEDNVITAKTFFAMEDLVTSNLALLTGLITGQLKSVPMPQGQATGGANSGEAKTS